MELVARPKLDTGGLGARGEQKRGAAWKGTDVLCPEDALSAQRHGVAAVAVAVVDGADGDVVVADEAGDVLGDAGVVESGTDDLDGGGGPERVHAVIAPHPDALLVGLQDGERGDAAGAEVAVELGQVTDATDVGRLVQDDDQGRVEAA